MGEHLSNCKVKATELYDDTMNCLTKYAEEYELFRPKQPQNHQDTDIFQNNENDLGNFAKKDDLYETENLEKKGF